jgi:citrate lyase subunit beta / citryl-CoA lyase
MPPHRAGETARRVTPRSLLFVPGDRPFRMPKAASSGADALILDLEDSVTPANKGAAREAIAAFLAQPRTVPLIVRISPLDSAFLNDDLTAIVPCRPDGYVLPKSEGAHSVAALAARLGDAPPPILPIATETPAAIFGLASYAGIAAHLYGLTWGAEDLPAAIGASTSREDDGRYTAPYELARSLTLFAAHAAGVPAIETVYPDIADTAGLKAFVQRARRDGFTGMMAIHPSQVTTINQGFTPSSGELDRARAIVAAFDADPQAGALKIDGKMVDAPHLKQARALLARID